MSKEYLGITYIFTSVTSEVEPTAFEKIFEKSTKKRISDQFVIISEHLERMKHPRGAWSNTCLAKWEGEEKEINRPVNLPLISNDMEPIARHEFYEDKKWR